MAVPVNPIGSYVPPRRPGSWGLPPARRYVYRSGVTGLLWESAVATPGTMYAVPVDASGQTDFVYRGSHPLNAPSVIVPFSCVPAGSTWEGDLPLCSPPPPPVAVVEPAPVVLEPPAVEVEPPSLEADPPAMEVTPPPAGVRPPSLRFQLPRFVVSLPNVRTGVLDAPSVAVPNVGVTRTKALPPPPPPEAIEPEEGAPVEPEPIEPAAEVIPEPVPEEEAEPIPEPAPDPELAEPDEVTDLPEEPPPTCGRDRGGPLHDHAAGSYAPAHGARERGGNAGLRNADLCGGNSGFVSVGGNTHEGGAYAGGGAIDTDLLEQLGDASEGNVPEGADEVSWWEDFSEQAEATYDDAEVAVTGTYETVQEQAEGTYQDAADAVSGAAQDAGELLGGSGGGQGTQTQPQPARGLLIVAALLLIVGLAG